MVLEQAVVADDRMLEVLQVDEDRKIEEVDEDQLEEVDKEGKTHISPDSGRRWGRG